VIRKSKIFEEHFRGEIMLQRESLCRWAPHCNIAISYANLGEIKAPAKPVNYLIERAIGDVKAFIRCKYFLHNLLTSFFSDYYPSFCFKYIQSLVTILSLNYENTTEIDFGTRPALPKELQALKSKSRISFSQNNK
jgi:hypothetical protein